MKEIRPQEKGWNWILAEEFLVHIEVAKEDAQSLKSLLYLAFNPIPNLFLATASYNNGVKAKIPMSLLIAEDEILRGKRPQCSPTHKCKVQCRSHCSKEGITEFEKEAGRCF